MGAQATLFLAMLAGAPLAFADFASQCNGCHNSGFLLNTPRVNAAGAGSAIIGRAIAIPLMSPAAPTDSVSLDNIGNEILGFIGALSQNRTVEYHSINNAISVNKLEIAISNFLDRLVLTNGAAGTNIGAGLLGTESFTYTHSAANCNPVTITVAGREGAAGVQTADRTINVSVNKPNMVAANHTYPAIAYSTGNTLISVAAEISSNPVAGTAAIGTINLSGGPSPTGTSAAVGATSFNVASNATTYAPTITQQYSVDGPCAPNSSNVATATIPVNLPPAPVVVDFAQTVPAASPTIINLTAPARISGVVLRNPAPAPGTYDVNASQPTAPGSGSTAVSAVNTITYTPPGAFTGVTTITYTKPGPGGTSNTGTITLTVTAAPVGTDFVGGTTAFNTPILVDVGPQIAGTFTPPVATPGMTNGTTSIAGTVVTFTPTVGYFGPASFTYTATGPGGTSTPNTVTITVLPPPPTTGNAIFAGTYQTPVVVDLTASITGVQTPPVTAFNPVNGTITGVAGNQVTFTPANGFIGVATFQYTAAGPGGTSAPPSTVTINVGAPPPPVAQSILTLVSSSMPTVIDLTASITGFSNAVAVVGQPAFGSATASGNRVTYTPDPGLPSGASVTFTYQATGPGGVSNIATVTMSYTSAPITPNRTVVVPFNTITIIDLASGIAGLYSSINIATQPQHGTILVRGNEISYTPNGGYFGPDSFTYTATGTGGTSQPGTVSITVNPLQATVQNGTLSVAFNTPTPVNLQTYISGVATSFVITTQPSHGTIVIAGNIATYTPTNGYFGADTFAFAAVNGAGTSAPATINVTVGSLKPLAGTASMIVDINTSKTLDLRPFTTGSGVTGVNVSKKALHGTVEVNGTTVTYTPRKDFFGPDSFQYVAFGNLGASTPATVNVTVVGRPDPRDDPNVRGLVNAQSQVPSRFSRAQVSNFQRRMETLHRGPDSAFPAAPVRTPTPETNPAGDGAAPAGTPAEPTPKPNAMAPSSPSFGAAPPRSASAVPGSLVSSLVSLATSQSMDVNGASVFRDGTTVWTSGLVQFGELEATGGGRSGSRFSTDGVSVGVDKRFGERLVLGFGGGYARDRSGIGNQGTTSKSSGASLAVYGSYQPTAKTYLDALIGYGKIDLDSSRFVEPLDLYATGTRRVDQVFGSIAGGYEWRQDGVLVSPYLRYDFSSDKFKQASESGAGQYNLTFAGQTQTSSQMAIGLRAEAQHEADFGRVIPRARVEYRREFQDDRSTKLSYADLFSGPEYTVTSTGVSRNALLLGVGADFILGRGLKLGFDYTGERSSGTNNVQAVRLFVSQDLDFKGPSAFRFTSEALAKPISIDFGFTYDDNVSRGRLDSEKRSDSLFSMGVGQEWVIPLGTNYRLVATPLVTAEKFRLYSGLGRFSGGMSGEVQYRTSGAFNAITFAVKGSAIYDQYESNLRSGGRYFLGVNARQSVTDKIDLFGEIGANRRDGKSEVFQLRDWSAKANVDYSLGRHGLIYAAGEFRKGDTFASGTAGLVNLAIADVFVADDAFNNDLFTYRLEARTALGTVGFNRPLGPRDSIDFSYRRVQTDPTHKPSFEYSGPLRYIDNQYSIVYLLRF
ncbi:hypothetical protein BWI17_13370 [Betaproteobacteria bacterium GR16-43]|nr:hypothetical protein BWI17_13370 [Betaproteobacteria bacterium GR16-43]